MQHTPPPGDRPESRTESDRTTFTPLDTAGRMEAIDGLAHLRRPDMASATKDLVDIDLLPATVLVGGGDDSHGPTGCPPRESSDEFRNKLLEILASGRMDGIENKAKH